MARAYYRVKEVFPMDTRERNTKSGYKKNWAKYVGIYVVLGGIVYLLVYLFAFHHGGGMGGGY
ncbi:MAG TPA: hypothetical protein VJ818_07295 [Actinomycetota bacterium]|nr:hypothetical protein [Actinomycetota bacterium]